MVTAASTALELEVVLNEATQATSRDLASMDDDALVKLASLLLHAPDAVVLHGKLSLMGTQASVNVLRELHRRAEVRELEGA